MGSDISRLVDTQTFPNAILRQFQDENSLTANEVQVKQNYYTVKNFLTRTRITSPKQITKATVLQYLAELKSMGGLGQKRILNIKSAISRFCDFLNTECLLEKNPCHEIRIKAAKRPPPPYLSLAEVAQAVEFAKTIGMAGEVAIAIYCGLRLGELCQLRWADVDWNRKMITVPYSKNGEFRLLPINQHAMDALKMQRNVSGNMAWVFPAYKCGFGFSKMVNKPRSKASMVDHLRPMMEQFPPFARVRSTRCGRGFHLLRHTYCTLLAQQGTPESTIGGWAGNPTAVKRYIHLAAGYDPRCEF